MCSEQVEGKRRLVMKKLAAMPERQRKEQDYPPILTMQRAEYCAHELIMIVKEKRLPCCPALCFRKLWVRASHYICWNYSASVVTAVALVSVQRTATVQVIIPPDVDNGESSFPLLQKHRNAKLKKPQRWVTCLGFRVYETDAESPEQRLQAMASSGVGGSHVLPRKLDMAADLRARFQEAARDRDRAEVEARRSAGKGGKSGRPKDDPDDRWL